MAKANITLPDGTTIVIDGNETEICSILSLYSKSGEHEGARRIENRVKSHKRSITNEAPRSKTGTQQFILELQEADFFKSKRTISDVQKELECEGHILPLNELSTPLRRLVSKKHLKRLNEKGTWVYVNR